MRLCFCLIVGLLLPAAVAAQSEQHPSDLDSPAVQSKVSPIPDTTEPTDPPGSQQTVATAPGQQSSQPGDKSKDDMGIKKAQPSGTSNDRLFWALPDFLTVQNAGHIPPLTSGQKFKVVARSTFDPIGGVFLAFIAGVNQASNSDRGYEQGTAGYAKRYGAAFGDNIIENFMTSAVLPSFLKQDPCYYQLGKGSFFHRTGYAIGQIFITRSISGRAPFLLLE